MLKAFHDRLRDLCADDGEGPRRSRAQCIENETKQVRALADEFGLLKQAGLTWGELLASEPDLDYCTEHIVEFSDDRGRVGKITIPGAFGLIPQVLDFPAVNLRGDPSAPTTRRALEFVPAGPIEYLSRWIDANALFKDDVKLVSVIEWADERLSFGITQPQYNGEPATVREIETFFEAAGWTHIPDPAGTDGHLLFFNYAWNVLAIDALPRNCFVREGQLLPFDVILCRPDPAMEEFLSLHPG
ncbi:MAG TPA: hypothetical protein VHM91_15965 [Verrucomicrobiales bacterium]|jgi:hypothetical protein|nr:hypothetical protein [Verrucomicrobiales bacterium]